MTVYSDTKKKLTTIFKKHNLTVPSINKGKTYQIDVYQNKIILVGSYTAEYIFTDYILELSKRGDNFKSFVQEILIKIV